MKFASREDAGCRLGKFLRERGIAADLVLGLPRGGVVVAAEVARELKLPLDVLVVRKIGHPLQREFAVGALAEPDIVILDEGTLLKVPVPRSDLDRVISEEMERLHEYSARFHFSERLSLAGKIILLVDDGGDGRNGGGRGIFRKKTGRATRHRCGAGGFDGCGRTVEARAG